VILIDSPEKLEEFLKSPAAITFIHFDWSGQSFQSLKVFEHLERAARGETDLKVKFFRFDPEDHPSLRDWLAAKAKPGDLELSGGGFGSVVWMKSGKVVDFERFAAKAGPSDLLVRSLKAFS